MLKVVESENGISIRNNGNELYILNSELDKVWESRPNTVVYMNTLFHSVEEIVKIHVGRRGSLQVVDCKTPSNLEALIELLRAYFENEELYVNRDESYIDKDMERF